MTYTDSPFSNERTPFTSRSCVGRQDPLDARGQEEAAQLSRRRRRFAQPARRPLHRGHRPVRAARRSRRSSRSTPTARCTGCKVGAQPTEQAGKLLEIAGVWAAYKADVGKDAVVEAEGRR